ncbi:ProP effector [Halomonas sp. THAF5a]|uniref:ProQ/FINO family protein n=1 Tax=Halomonas sp. THAF5a TaxID=2587844 RepID=UPI0012692342|nr:ProQ/FINO family protein [Halomonas sp. THAF5a]QFU02601.1 ProP effector [Halomonas sp. THAF5a]
MIEEGSTRLLERLEQRASALLAQLRASRVQQDALQSRLDELERRRVELEASQAERAAEVREEQAARQALAERCGELEARLKDLEATRQELAEENRELDEQNRELEAHNRRLLAEAPAEAEAGSVLFHRQARRAQGLSALIGDRARRQPADEAAAPSPEQGEALEAAAPESTDMAPTDDTPSTVEATPPAGDEAPSPQALLDQWYRRYPSTFFKGHTRPLKVGIHEELTAREPWPEKLVRRALACYVNLPRYLKSVREGAGRLDLAGEPAGQVDAAAAEHAHKKLERLQADRRQRGRPARGRGQGGARRHGDAGAKARRGEAPTAQATPAANRPGGGAKEGAPAATLDEKLSALLAKHNQR